MGALHFSLTGVHERTWTDYRVAAGRAASVDFRYFSQEAALSKISSFLCLHPLPNRHRPSAWQFAGKPELLLRLLVERRDYCNTELSILARELSLDL